MMREEGVNEKWRERDDGEYQRKAKRKTVDKEKAKKEMEFKTDNEKFTRTSKTDLWLEIFIVISVPLSYSWGIYIKRCTCARFSSNFVSRLLISFNCFLKPWFASFRENCETLWYSRIGLVTSANNLWVLIYSRQEDCILIIHFGFY